MTDRRHKVYEGTIIGLHLEDVTLPNGTTLRMEIVDHPGGAAVVAVDAQQQVCLLHQYRHIAGGYLWELPAGKIDDREPPLQTAQRELADEAGVRAGDWVSLGDIVSSPGVFSEVIHLWLARDLTLGKANTDDDEVLEVHWVPMTEALRWALTGQIRDAKSIIGLLRAAAVLRLEAGVKYEQTENPAAEDVQLILDSLTGYNAARAGKHPKQRMAVFARNIKNRIVGGATGEVTWGWLYVEMLWVHEDYRAQDIGSTLLERIENMARPYNVIGFHLGTTDFQALDFYLKNGYQVWGQLADFPPGHTNYALRKLAAIPDSPV